MSDLTCTCPEDDIRFLESEFQKKLAIANTEYQEGLRAILNRNGITDEMMENHHVFVRPSGKGDGLSELRLTGIAPD